MAPTLQKRSSRLRETQHFAFRRRETPCLEASPGFGGFGGGGEVWGGFGAKFSLNVPKTIKLHTCFLVVAIFREKNAGGLPCCRSIIVKIYKGFI